MKTKGFTPVVDSIREKVGGVGALIYGVMWRYAQQHDMKICFARIKTIAERASVDEKTVRKYQAILAEKGYISEVGRTKGGTIDWICNANITGEILMEVRNEIPGGSELNSGATKESSLKKDKPQKDVLDWYTDHQRPSTETAHDGSWFPVDVKKYLNPFTVCFKRRYKREATKSERGYWIRECREWSVRGYDYNQVPDAFQLCIDRDITIKSPRSITWAFDQLSAEDGEFLAKEM